MGTRTRHPPKSKPTVTSELLDRLPPSSLDSEKAVIGSILYDPRLIDEVAEVVREADFYAAGNQKLFRHLVAMNDAGARIDERLLVERLQQAGDLEAIGGAAYLLEVIHSVSVSAHAVQYAEIVAEKARLRRVITAALDAVRDCYAAESSAEDIAAKLERELAETVGARTTDSIVTAADAARLASERFDALRNRPGEASVLTGLYEIDNGPGGLFPGELTVLAARPGMGKTSLALQIALHCGRRNRLTYFATAEMGAAELAARKICGMAKVPGRKARTGDLSDEEMTAIVEASNEFACAALWIDQRPRMTTADIRRGAKRASQKGLSLVCVDYLGLLRPTDPKLPREQQVSTAAWDLKQLARELHVPVLLVSQLNRQADENEQPDLRHLRESGAIEQHADAVWFLWAHSPTTEKRYNACFGVAKNRNGEKGTFGLDWISAETRFESPDPANFEPAFGAYAERSL
jgi:replicative DNA helicase